MRSQDKEIEQSKDIQGLWTRITGLGGEGIILKDANAPYFEETRSPRWLKVKDIKEVVLKFTSFKDHPKGIRIETDNGIAITVNGWASADIKREIVNSGSCLVEIRHLGETEAGKYRQPVFFRRAEVEI